MGSIKALLATDMTRAQVPRDLTIGIASVYREWPNSKLCGTTR
jgi:hypothetical protein